MTEAYYPQTSGVELTINGIEVPPQHVIRFEWMSQVNNGYFVVGEVVDRDFLILRSLQDSNLEYMENARQKPTVIEWSFFHLADTTKKKKTQSRIAYLINLSISGTKTGAVFSFYAQDPPTFLLSAGVADGKVYTGKIGGSKGVIAQCVKEFTALNDKESKISVEVTDTDDSQNGIWPMFRMDPKTYIKSLLDWSSSLTKNKESRWLISCNDHKMLIKKAIDMKNEGKNFGPYSIASTSLIDNKIMSWEIKINNFITNYQSKLLTAGFSSTTGSIVETFVDDENTPKKVTPFKKNEGKNRAPSKPKRGKDWPVDLPATFIRSVPEHSGGEVYKNYADYIDGRARQIYENTLSDVMRMTICIPGIPTLDNSNLLGISTCTINWPRPVDDPWIAHGQWIIDGFYHEFSKDNIWVTHLSLYRIDWDSKAEEISPPPAS